MRREIVHNHDVTTSKLRNEYLLNVSKESLPVGRAVEHSRGECSPQADSGDYRAGLPVSVRHFGHQTLADRRSPPQASQVALGSAFVNKHKLIDVYAFELPVPSSPQRLDVGAVLLGGVQDFFFKVSLS